MASKIEICNLALAEISTSTITSIDEATEPARKCRLFWDTTRKSVLNDYDWSFAKKISLLSVSSNDSIINWEYAYVYPSDCLTPRKLFTQQNNENAVWNWLTNTLSISSEPQTFKIIHSELGSYQIILSNAPDAYLEYTADIIDTTLFDSSFVEALKYNLAAKLSKSLTGNDNLKKDLLQLYVMAVDAAKRNNNLRNYESPSITKNSPFFDCR